MKESLQNSMNSTELINTSLILLKTRSYVNRKCQNIHESQFMQDKLFAKEHQYYRIRSNTKKRFKEKVNYVDPYRQSDDKFLKQLRSTSQYMNESQEIINNQKERYFHNLLRQSKSKYGEKWQSRRKTKFFDNFINQNESAYLQVKQSNPKLAFVAQISPSKNNELNKLKQCLQVTIDKIKENKTKELEQKQQQQLMKKMKFNPKLIE